MKGEITCFDINGNSQIANYVVFELNTRNGIKKLEFRTYLSNDLENEWFDFKVAVLEDNIMKVTDMFIGKEEHRKKGIPEALILEVKRLFKKKVISSSNKNPNLISESRRDEASKVWERLVKLGKAKYDEIGDVYALL